MAAALVAETGGAAIESIDDVVNIPGANVCIRTAMQSSFQMRYPALTGRFHTRDGIDDLLNDMDDGLCVAAVIMKDAWERQLVSTFLLQYGHFVRRCNRKVTTTKLRLVFVSAGQIWSSV
jgi:hypothetical protein